MSLLVFTIYDQDGRLSELTTTAHLGHRLLSQDWGDHSRGAGRAADLLLTSRTSQSEGLSLPRLDYKDGDSHCVSNLSLLLALLKRAATGKGPSMWPGTEGSLGPAAQGELRPENRHTSVGSEVDANRSWCLWPWLTERLPPLRSPEPEVKSRLLVHRDDDTTKCVILSQ